MASSPWIFLGVRFLVYPSLGPVMVFEIGLLVMMNVPLAYLPPITLLPLPSIIGSLNSTFVILQLGLVLLFMTLLRIIMEIILEYPMTVLVM